MTTAEQLEVLTLSIKETNVILGQVRDDVLIIKTKTAAYDVATCARRGQLLKWCCAGVLLALAGVGSLGVYVNLYPNTKAKPSAPPIIQIEASK